MECLCWDWILHDGNLLCWIRGPVLCPCSNRAIVSCFGVKMGYETPLDRLVQKSWGNNWLRWKENLTDEARLIWKKICWCLITCGEKNFLPQSLMSCPNGCCVCLILKYVWVRTCMQIEVHFFFEIYKVEDVFQLLPTCILSTPCVLKFYLTNLASLQSSSIAHSIIIPSICLSLN